MASIREAAQRHREVGSSRISSRQSSSSCGTVEVVDPDAGKGPGPDPEPPEDPDPDPHPTQPGDGEGLPTALLIAGVGAAGLAGAVLSRRGR